MVVILLTTLEDTNLKFPHSKSKNSKTIGVK